ncbi:MAG TPA: hypothetical protein VME43_00540 [Bryobacteraceae bacterium]|nr:hypothetical protein [Bryobacteraceae bacterium]
MWDKSKKNPSSSGASAAPALETPALSAGAEASVRQLIANGKHKVAVETAKGIHKAHGTAASEALLLDAYAARIQSLLDKNLAAEAKALSDLVCERYPSARARLHAGNGAGIDACRFEELVRPLNDPDLSAERRSAIEAAIAREPGAPAALAECAALPPEHPLRQAASAVQRAFLAVTAGPVAEEAVELPEVSRRSPLAPWKLLVRAIACFYRGEDDTCHRYLDAIPPETAPARLVPAMQAMLGGEPAGMTPAAAALVSSTTSDPAALRKALEALEAGIRSGKDAAAVKAIREAVQVCRETAPGQLEKLKQHISIRAAMASVKKEKAQAAMGGPAVSDAYFLRLFARGMEEIGDPENLALACGAWDQFRQQAVREGWFTANGPEAATLYLHMAGVLRKLPLELLAALQKDASRQTRQSGEDLYFLYPGKLYERACALDPHFESFSQWTEWAKRGRAGQAEKVAEVWHKIRPTDIEPILLLMEEREKRNAFHTSLQYLAKAERIDSVHPAVRRARLRLLAGSALRHVQQNKLNLAEEKLAEMAALPQSQQGDRPAYLAALHYLVCAIRGAADQAAAQRVEVERALGSKVAAALLIYGVAHAAKQDPLGILPRIATYGKKERAALPEALIRVLELVKDFRTTQDVPGDWLLETAKQFAQSSQSLNVGQLQTLGEAALCAERFDLAYAVSAAGLERGGPSEAAFLLMRALALLEVQQERSAVCAAAAAQLARRDRQMDVLDEAVELLSDCPLDDLSLTPEQASTVARTEKAARDFPTDRQPGPRYEEFLGEPLCNCPECRRARAEAAGPYGEDFEDDDDDDVDFDALMNGMELPPDMPPEVAKIMFQETQKSVQRGESLDSLLKRLFGPAAASRRTKKGRRR